jgi:hypothetical protein
MTTQDLLAAVKSIQPLIEAHAAEAEANRQLSSVGYDAMCRANLFAMSSAESAWGARTPPSGEHAGLGGDRTYRFGRCLEFGNEPGYCRVCRLAPGRGRGRSFLSRRTNYCRCPFPLRRGDPGGGWVAGYRSGFLRQRLSKRPVARNANDRNGKSSTKAQSGDRAAVSSRRLLSKV